MPRAAGVEFLKKLDGFFCKLIKLDFSGKSQVSRVSQVSPYDIDSQQFRNMVAEKLLPRRLTPKSEILAVFFLAAHVPI